MRIEVCAGRRRWRRLKWALIGLASSGVALADKALIPYVSESTEYNSNVFDLPDRDTARALGGDGTLADISLRTIAGVLASLPWRDQKFHATVEGRRIDFAHFDGLDHYEYRLEGGLDWRVTGAVDGNIDYRQERRMASFADRGTTALTLETERTGSAGVNLKITPELRLETGLRAHRLNSPLPGSPEFRITENSVHAALKYLVADALAAGFFAEFLAGRFEGAPDARNVRQKSLALTLDYAVAGLSRLGVQLGYTQRQDGGGDAGNLSGIAGRLSYHRELTGKTAADVEVFRRVSSAVLGASSVAEIGAGGSIEWRPTEKLSVALAYQWSRSRFQQSNSVSISGDRADVSQLASVKLNYQVLPWLLLRPYVGLEIRDSSIRPESFNRFVGGLEVRAQFP